MILSLKMTLSGPIALERTVARKCIIETSSSLFVEAWPNILAT